MTEAKIHPAKLKELVEIQSLINSRLDALHIMHSITLSAIGLLTLDSAELWLEVGKGKSKNERIFALFEAKGFMEEKISKRKPRDALEILLFRRENKLSEFKVTINLDIKKVQSAGNRLRKFVSASSYTPAFFHTNSFTVTLGKNIQGFFTIGRKEGQRAFNDEDLFLFSKLIESLVLALNNSLKMEILKIELKDAQTKSQYFSDPFPQIIGQSEAIRHVKNLVRQLGPSHINILIEGERGTGKELIAEALYKQSNRRDKPFVRINCAGIVEGLLESELFGHEKGAFTGAISAKKGLMEAANGGTLLLDEIAEMKESLQGKLLRVLQEGTFRRVGGEKEIKVDIRIISATNRHVTGDTKGKILRRDLFDRLATFVLKVPGLRERRDDILLLAYSFLKRFTLLENKIYLRNISPQARKFFEEYEWPGNIRELENMVHRMVILSPGEDLIISEDTIGAPSLENQSYNKAKIKVPSPGAGSQDSFQKAKGIFEESYIHSLLAKTEGNISKASRISGLDRNNIKLKMKKYNISRAEFLSLSLNPEP